MAKKTIYFDSYCGLVMYAVVENGKISEFSFEKNDDASIIGNIYKGRVESVLPGMNAAFVNCGLERNCYLSADDIFPDAGKYDGENGGEPVFPELKEGDEIAVQVVKPPIGSKGAKVTACFSFVGKHIIYMPDTPFVGVSRKIEDDELRKNLIFSANKLKSQSEGIILRTAAPYAKRDVLQAELGYLRNLYAGVQKAYKTAKTGDLIYTGLPLPMRVMRDTLSYDIEKIVVGTPALEKLISDLVNLYPSANRRPVCLHGTGRDMMSETGLGDQIMGMTSPRVKLDNGAYLVIEKTEALTVIDVNTGKFTGDDSLEQTVYYTNILAAREIARQVKLRNIGGIVVVDFIDMSSLAHRNSLAEELERALKRDSAKCFVAPVSQFGLVEFTRKRTGTNPLSLMVRPCRHCRSGYVKTPRFILLGMRAKLIGLYADGERALRVDMNGELLTELLRWEQLCGDLRARLKDCKLYFVAKNGYADEQLKYRTGDIFPLPDKAVEL